MILIFLLLIAFQLYGIANALEIAPDDLKEPSHPCPSCSRDIEPGWIACPSCRQILSTRCDACGEIDAFYHTYCAFCGTSREKMS